MAVIEFFGALADWFLRESRAMKLSDAIGALALCVTSASVVYAARTFSSQRRLADLTAHIQLRREFSDAFRRFKDAQNEDRHFEFAELMNIFESVCHLYNRDVIYGASREMVRDYILEILNGIRENVELISMVKENLSSKNTFSEIKRFMLAEGRDDFF